MCCGCVRALSACPRGPLKPSILNPGRSNPLGDHGVLLRGGRQELAVQEPEGWLADAPADLGSGGERHEKGEERERKRGGEREGEGESVREQTPSSDCAGPHSLVSPLLLPFSLPRSLSRVQVPGGYLLRQEAGDLKYMAAFNCPEAALSWAIAVQVREGRAGVRRGAGLASKGEEGGGGEALSPPLEPAASAACPLIAAVRSLCCLFCSPAFAGEPDVR